MNWDRRVAVVLPAYNEEPRISFVLQGVLSSNIPDEVIVVCDGCTDGTATIARRFSGVAVLELEANCGKAAAMMKAVQSSQADIFLFLDADLLGLRSQHVRDLLGPVLAGEVGMTIGIFHGGRFWSDLGHKISPNLSGQRAMTREFISGLDHAETLGMGVEIALNQMANRAGIVVRRVTMVGVSNFHKEAKLGLLRGLGARARMYREVGRSWLKHRGGWHIRHR